MSFEMQSAALEGQDEEKMAKVHAAAPSRGGSRLRPSPRRPDRGAASRRPISRDTRGGRCGPPSASTSISTRCLSRDHRDRAQGRCKKQTGGPPGPFGDSASVLEPLAGHQGYEFVDKMVGGPSAGFRPAVDKGVQEAMARGELAGARRAGRARPPARGPLSTTTWTHRRWRSRSAGSSEHQG